MSWYLLHSSLFKTDQSGSFSELLEDTYSYLWTVLVNVFIHSNSTQTTFSIVDSNFTNFFFDLESVIGQTIPVTLENGVGCYCSIATPTEAYSQK